MLVAICHSPMIQTRLQFRDEIFIGLDKNLIAGMVAAGEVAKDTSIRRRYSSARRCYNRLLFRSPEKHAPRRLHPEISLRKVDTMFSYTRLPLVASTLLLALVTAGSAAEPKDNQLTPEEKAAGWKVLFNGHDYTGWKCNNGKEVASPVEENSLVPHRSGGYLVVYDKPFGDFVLKCDVKMGEECNSGIFFRIGDLKNPVQTGFEAQVYAATTKGYHGFGAIYDLVPPSGVKLNGAGQWDHLTITCNGPHVSVDVNGKTVAELNCDEWTQPGKRLDGTPNKFTTAVKDFPRKGYLGFQDHGHKVWFKNIKILELKADQSTE